MHCIFTLSRPFFCVAIIAAWTFYSFGLSDSFVNDDEPPSCLCLYLVHLLWTVRLLDLSFSLRLFAPSLSSLPNSSSHSPFHSSASVSVTDGRSSLTNGPFPTLFGCGPRDRWDDPLQSLVSHICHHLGALSLFRSLSPPFTAHLIICSPRSFNQPYFSHMFGLSLLGVS